MSKRPQWTAAARAAFIASLAECGEVRAALTTVGLSPKSAYRLRTTDADFDRAWDAALLHSRHAVVAELTSRALHGWQEEVWFRGELVGTRTRHDNRLLLALLARLDRAAGTADQPERTQRAAPHFADLLAALRHDMPLDPWFAPTLAEKQEEAIDAACRRNRFWNFAALMDEATIDAVMGGRGQNEDDDDDDIEQEDKEDDEAEHDTARPSPAGAPALSRTAQTKPAEALHSTSDVSPPRGRYPVLPLTEETPENQGHDAAAGATPGDGADPGPLPSPPPKEPSQPAGPPTADQRDAFDGDLARLGMARFEPVIRLNPFAPS